LKGLRRFPLIGQDPDGGRPVAPFFGETIPGVNVRPNCPFFLASWVPFQTSACPNANAVVVATLLTMFPVVFLTSVDYVFAFDKALSHNALSL